MGGDRNYFVCKSETYKGPVHTVVRIQTFFNKHDKEFISRYSYK